ncbi:hypothetical protein EVAR_53028_1 [Eumeta japonica]|uniref:Histone-lysine N-methyltransferase SETMAR n=1 Tax=Eumeta variegata TaxID=151549 RepID=A0A4C1XQT2_EUMVA|nr:hypothetical protein EVAR_53028_1 [Eumeta japonica]
MSGRARRRPFPERCILVASCPPVRARRACPPLTYFSRCPFQTGSDCRAGWSHTNLTDDVREERSSPTTTEDNFSAVRLMTDTDKTVTYQQIRTSLGIGFFFIIIHASSHAPKQMFDIEILAHPPYNADLTRCDFYLFPKIKKKNFEESGLRSPRKQWLHMKRPSKQPVCASG